MQELRSVSGPVGGLEIGFARGIAVVTGGSRFCARVRFLPDGSRISFLSN